MVKSTAKKKQALDKGEIGIVKKVRSNNYDRMNDVPLDDTRKESEEESSDEGKQPLSFIFQF